MRLFWVLPIACLISIALGQLIPITEGIPDDIRAEIRANHTKNTVRGRIAFGYRAFPGQFPFASWLHFLLDGNYIIQCGATLIKSDFVVTAAHCFGDNFRAIDIWTGSVDKNAFPTFRRGSFYVKHPLWQAPGTRNLEHDIGLIQLEYPVTETPAYLPPRWSTAADYNSQTMITTGWGGTELGGISQFLLYTKVIGNPACEADNVICAKGVGNSENRGGDSGGSLLTEGNTLIGVVSFGWAGYNGYVRVDRYLDWIVGYTKQTVL